ncbi:MAG TPA: carboxypeptidase regulatory-like domain-containing protein, partial [Kofleriaceae bacterium]
KPGPFGVMATDVHGRWGSAKGSIANGEIKTIDIELANDGMLCGTVHDKQGAAIAGLDLVANDAEQEDSGDATTAIDGAFCIGKLANEGTYTLSASLDGQAVTVDHPPVVLEHRADVPLVIDLKFSTIAGTVADHTGAPVPDVVVRANAVTTAADFAFDASSGAVTLTDHAGQFSLSHLPLGTYRILALARTGNASSTGAITAGTHGVTIILDDVGSIQGKLVGFTTAPSIVGTFMTGGRENIDFEVDGATFKATGLAPGDYTLQVDTFGHEADSKRVTVKAGETTQVSLSSRGTTSLDGTTVDWKTNAPLPDVRCSPPIATDHGNVGGVYNLVDSQAISDARGHFHMSDVSAGEAIVMCVGANLFGIRATTLTRDQLSTVSVAIVARDPANHSIGASFNAINRSIIQLLADGAAARAGLQIDDEVEAVDARSVEDLVGEPLMAVITNRPAGSVAKLRIKRGGDTRDIAVVVSN